MLSSRLSVVAVAVILVLSLSEIADAFVPAVKVTTTTRPQQVKIGRSPAFTPLHMGFLGDKERERLTRADEPEDYFKTYVRSLLMVNIILPPLLRFSSLTQEKCLFPSPRINLVSSHD